MYKADCGCVFKVKKKRKQKGKYCYDVALCCSEHLYTAYNMPFTAEAPRRYNCVKITKLDFAVLKLLYSSR